MKQKKLEEVMIGDILMAVKDGCFYPVDSFLSDSDDSNHTQDYFYFKFLGSVSKRVMKKMFATTNNEINVYDSKEIDPIMLLGGGKKENVLLYRYAML